MKMEPKFLKNEAYRPFVASSLLLLIISTISVIGYTILSPTHSILDATYMTVITLTTVGYGEIIDMSHNPMGRVFTMFILFSGVGTLLYFFSAFTGFIVEGNVERIFRRKRMLKKIAHLANHYIVCGGGFTGRHLARELAQTGRPFVLIDLSETHIKDVEEHAGDSFPSIVGDATDDRNLIAAGIERARGVFACLEHDKDNLIITVSARMLNPKIRIISRCQDEDVVDKIRRAGADDVVSPTMIGGLRMASTMVRPTVVSFLDVMLRDQANLRVEQSTIAPGSALDGKSVGHFKARHVRDALLIALRNEDGSWNYNPADSVGLTAPVTLIYMCSPGVREEVERYCTAG